MLSQGFINFNGNEMIVTKDLFKDVNNNFTYEFWINPQEEINLSKLSNSHLATIPDQPYIIGPGDPGLNKPDEAGIGISVGTNGIAIYELSQNHLTALLTYKIEISEWAHIAIAFENKMPRLYVNGHYKISGITSTKKHVFASGRIGGLDSCGHFKGIVNDLRLWNYSKTHGQVRSYMDKQLKGDEQGLVFFLNYDNPTTVLKYSTSLNSQDVEAPCFNRDFFGDVNDNFTYEFWIKPQEEINLSKLSNSHLSTIPDQPYIIGPGDLELTQPNESGICISVGINGIAVYELSQNHLTALLAYKIEIAERAHIAIVFENKTPRLYVNGNYKIRGITSTKNHVFASGEIMGLDSGSHFKGGVNDLWLWNYPKTHDQVRSNMNKQLKGDEPGLVFLLNYENQTFVLKHSLSLNSQDVVAPYLLPEPILHQYCLESFNQANHYNVDEKLYKDVQVDVIIPIYDAYELTKKCIESVINHDDIPYNLYLINDASTDKRIYEFLEEKKLETLPGNIKKLAVIHHETNQGFVKSVNKGLLLTTNHPILLNSDTEIPHNCFRRLIQPILLNNTVASVTPFSNSAAICSFPEFLKDNGMPYNMDVNEIDNYFNKFSINKGIGIPTGIGFCMAMNRNVINQIGIFDDEVFGKGYGEENDWCRRAAKIGCNNLLMPNTFVYHKHGGSFNQNSDLKTALMATNLNKLVTQYPDYNRLIQQFISRDPAKNIRVFMKSILAAHKFSEQKGVLLVNHNLGGGTEEFQNDYIQTIYKEQRVYTLKPEQNHLVLIDHNHDQPINYTLDLNLLDEINFKMLLNAFHINEIFINHLLGFPLQKMFRLIGLSGVNYCFFIHDFYCVCPSFNLINQHKHYCNAQTDLQICQGCILNVNRKQVIKMKEWRDEFLSFLKGAAQIIAPSDSTKDIVTKYYPELKIIEVREHSIHRKIINTFKEEFLWRDPLNIAFIGAIGPEKGSKIIYGLKKLIIKENLPINIKVIGYTNKHYRPFESNDGKFVLTGKYEKEQLATLLTKHEVALVINASICPETFSYTTSESMLAGYPVITFNLGAPAERVKKYNCGWVVDQITTSGILKVLKRLIRNREEIKEKAEILKQMNP